MNKTTEQECCQDTAECLTAGVCIAKYNYIPDATKMVAEPVKQEPVAWTNYNGAVNNRIKAEQALQNLSDFHQHMEATEPKCSDHPDAPHGFDRNASHSADRYVCECEGWEPPKQEPVACACGDVYPADSFGAGFIAATGHCQNCDAAAPVDAKAIRAEAYQQGRNEMKEEAAKVCEERGWEFIEPIRECAAAIRNLKDKA